jgi:5'-nucleotidase
MADVEDKIALIDLDGTIADYDNEMRLQMAFLRAPGEPEYPHRPTYDDGEVPSYITARRKVIQRQIGFWRNLKPLALGFEVIEELRKLQFQLHVLTKGPRSTSNAWSEKLDWCKEHLPDALVTVTGDKSLVYGRVLVDDFPPYIEKWLSVRPRGLVVSIAHPWNADYAKGGSKENQNVLRYDGTNRAELISRLTSAFERRPRERA